MSESTQEREALVVALGAQTTEEDERLAREAAERRELEQRRQAVSPEALAGDEAALSTLDQIDAELAALDKQDELRRLAAAEQADRDRQAAEAELEANRAQWAREKAEAEASRDRFLVNIEKALALLVEAVPEALRLDQEADRLGKAIDPGYRQGPLQRSIEFRLSRRLGEVGMRDLGFVLDSKAGSEPLAFAKPRARVKRAGA